MNIQEQITNQVKNHLRALAMYTEGFLEGWVRAADVPEGEVEEYIQRYFEVRDHVDDTGLLERREIVFSGQVVGGMDVTWKVEQ